MANHLRQQIRERFATQVTGLATTGSNVYQSRFYNLEAGELPAILIYTAQEEIEAVSIGSNRVLERTLSLAVECYVKGVTNADDTVDTIAKEVEVAIATDNTLNGLAKDCYIASTEINYNGDGEKPVVVAVLTFNVIYHTREQSPDATI